MHQKVSVATIQAAAPAFDIDAGINEVERWVAQAADEGAQLIVFPEAFITGYPKGADFGARVGYRRPEGRALFQRYFDAALDLKSTNAERLAKIAARYRRALVVGVIERDGHTLYCTVVYIDTDGSYVGKHRKLMPTGTERLIWGQGDGSTIAPVDMSCGRVGAAICWENYMPMFRMSMYADGVQLYCAPTVDDRDSWIPTMRHIATEGRCFVLSSCQFARRRDFPEDFPTTFDATEDTVLIRGGSCIIDPYGQPMTTVEYGVERLALATINLADIPQAKYDLDVSGHYARADVFKLLVDRRARPSVADI
ncbi:MAG: carbon-nitrogen hydrolase family protein [Myxococcota bacterium]